MAFRNGPGYRPAIALTAVHQFDPVVGIIDVITCPGKGCSIRYAVPSAELSERRNAAQDRGEDLYLTAAYHASGAP
jgi:hypothetical protein